MQIKEMFKRDINRYINGVISVAEQNTIKQELEEYVVTRELQRHFSDFFQAYERGLDNPERNPGVWIQGYFGSGKSHFLKMLSYLLENKEVDGENAVDYFEDKFDDLMTYASIVRSSNAEAETILFNIDDKGGCYKEGETSETAVLRSIARVFYEHLGFYGMDYKLARFEKLIDDRGKTDEFRAAYEEITGNPWVEDRGSYDIFGGEVAEAANRAVGMSIKSVTDWADSTESALVDFGQLVDDIDEYAQKRERECGKQFRLLFMIDEMGQYLNGDTSRMLNLQTFMEKFCDRCGGRVWMVVTSQEAIDELMNVVSMDFSKIQGRFATRLSLSSSSVDEVIKKRVLDKNESAASQLRAEYAEKDVVLKNLFSFEDSRSDLKGFPHEDDFVECFPFVGYQFTLMPSVLKEIRRHGYQGKSLSTGERSMLSSYQEAAQAVEQGDERSLVPFWRFFDTLEKELDHGIKQVFARCRKAAENDYTIQEQDINVLKTLYLINYINDVKPCVGNIAILMADRIDMDMKARKESVKESLDRLARENYIARTGERYAFLTDVEQEVAREIKDEKIDPASVVEEVQKIIFSKIFTDRRFRKGANDFPIDRFVDDAIVGQSQQGMRLNVITMANNELADAADGVLDMKSSEQALLALDTESDYYDLLYNAARIKKYAQTRSSSDDSQTKRNIIQRKQEEAAQNRKEAEALIEDAIVHARVSVDGQAVQVPAATAKQKIEGVLDRLAGAIFTKSTLIDNPIDNDGQLTDVLLGRNQQATIEGGVGGNAAAAEEVLKYLEARTRLHQSTNMGELQRNFQGKPYGWREIDVASVVAKLIHDQKALISYGDARVSASDPKMKDYLRKQSMVDKATIEVRKSIPAAYTSAAKDFLRTLDSSMAVPSDEDGLAKAVKDCLEDRVERFRDMLRTKYRAERYPGRVDVEKAIHLASEVLAQKADPEALLRDLKNQKEDILDNDEDLGRVHQFFDSNQKNLFDEALSTLSTMRDESTYVDGDADVKKALAEIEGIVRNDQPYGKIKNLRGLIAQATESYGKLCKAKRDDMLGRLDAALAGIKGYAADQDADAQAAVVPIVSDAEQAALRRKSAIHDADTCTKLDAIGAQIDAWRTSQLSKIDAAASAVKQKKTRGPVGGKPVNNDSSNGQPSEKPAALKPKVVKPSTVLPPKALHNEEEIDKYLAELKARLLAELDGFDSIRLG